jgi:tetratricopeptide (TPR) repeat protein
LFVVLLLSAASVAAFFGTRAVAAWDRRLNERSARAAYASGEKALAEGQPGQAADLFRAALVHDRGRRAYALALADALVKSGRSDHALQVLAAQRELAPEDAEINLRLGRIAAAAGYADQAERYYHNAIYGLWPDDQPRRAQAARLELVRLLLKGGDSRSAEAELIAAGPTATTGPFTPLAAAQLFEAAGDTARARAEYLSALELNPNDPAALAGAGRTSFAQQDYDAALSYFASAQSHGDASAETADAATVARLVLDQDPLAQRLSAQERSRRVQDDLQHVAARIQTCATSSDAPPLLPIRDEVARLLTTFHPKARQRPSGGVVEALEAIVRAESAAGAACGAPSAMDRALLLIGRKHGVTPP